MGMGEAVWRRDVERLWVEFSDPLGWRCGGDGMIEGIEWVEIPEYEI